MIRKNYIFRSTFFFKCRGYGIENRLKVQRKSSQLEECGGPAKTVAKEIPFQPSTPLESIFWPCLTLETFHHLTQSHAYGSILASGIDTCWVLSLGSLYPNSPWCFQKATTLPENFRVLVSRKISTTAEWNIWGSQHKSLWCIKKKIHHYSTRNGGVSHLKYTQWKNGRSQIKPLYEENKTKQI